MTTSTLDSVAPLDALALDLPPGWVRFDSARLLQRVGTEPALSILSSYLGVDETEIAAPLPDLLAGIGVSGLVLSAMRVREEALDVLLVALPPEQPPNAEPEAADAEPADLTPAPDPSRHHVDVDGRAMIEHRSPASAADDEAPASVQLVVLVPPAGRGAIVTAISTAPGAQEELARDARAVARSLRLVTAERPR